LLIWKVVTLDLAVFMSLSGFDWIMLLLGLFALTFNSIVMLPYILGKSEIAFFKKP
jgi:hypothetical protein